MPIILLTICVWTSAADAQAKDQAEVRTGFAGCCYEEGTWVKLAKVLVRFVSEDGTLIKEVTSNQTGYYRIFLPKGRYKVKATCEGYEPYSSGKGFFVVTGGDRIQTGNFFLKKASQ